METFEEETKQESPEQGDTEPKKESFKNFIKEIIQVAVIALLIVVPIRVFVAQPYLVAGASMDPSYSTGHYIIVDQVTYNFDDPERGDVIIFKYPKDPSKFFIKRIIGLPGETVSLKQGVPFITNDEHPEGFTFAEPYLSAENQKIESLEITLSEDKYFVMGDNRKGSSDSRLWGSLDKDLIMGRAILRVLPLRDFGIFPGKYTPEIIIN